MRLFVLALEKKVHDFEATSGVHEALSDLRYFTPLKIINAVIRLG